MPTHPWVWPTAPWQHIHVDFAGPFLGHVFLIVVDTNSKWLEVEIMSGTTAEKTIDRLRYIFSHYGLPEQLVSDNGPQFVSLRFKHFMKENGIRHILVAPRHPRSNGQAERFVATFKQAMKAGSFGRAPSSTIQQRLMHFLLRYRTTTSTVTGATPEELFLKRRVGTRLDLLRPSFEKHVPIKQALQENVSDGSRSVTEFNVNDRVIIENFYGQPKWLSGTVVKRSGPVSYKVNVDGNVMQRHLDQMQSSDRAISLSRHPVEESVVSDL